MRKGLEQGLSPGDVLPSPAPRPGDIWLCLEIILVDTTGGMCYWHLTHMGRGTAEHPAMQGWPPPRRVIWPQMSGALRVRGLGAEVGKGVCAGGEVSVTGALWVAGPGKPWWGV